MSEQVPETAHLGRFDPLEAPIVLDMLHEHGIFAFSKAPLDQAEGQPYGSIFNDSARGRIFVDVARLGDAKRLIEEELPQRIAEMGRALEEGFAAQEEIAEASDDEG